MASPNEDSLHVHESNTNLRYILFRYSLLYNILFHRDIEVGFMIEFEM